MTNESIPVGISEYRMKTLIADSFSQLSSSFSTSLQESFARIDNLICSDRILTFGISICSPAKVGIGSYKAVNYQPGS